VQAETGLQAPAPSHSPLAWVAEGQEPVHVPSALLAGTFAQVPPWPEMLHDWQVGQLDEAQQKPSTQLPLEHSMPWAQAVPLAFFWQKPPMQL
jgi:hypothetical protein